MKREAMRARLLDAAETILVTEGAKAATVRAITTAAGVNVASVTTAFGGRSALLDELLARLLVPINRERERRYAAMNTPREVEAVVRAFVEPLATINPESALGPLLHALVLDADGTDRPLDRILTDPGVLRLTDELTSILPQQAPEDIRARVDLAVGTIFTVATQRADAGLTRASGFDTLVRFVSAGLRAESMTRGDEKTAGGRRARPRTTSDR